MIGLEVIETKYFLAIEEPTCVNLILSVCKFFHECFNKDMCLSFVSKIDALHLEEKYCILNFLGFETENPH